MSIPNKDNAYIDLNKFFDNSGNNHYDVSGRTKSDINMLPQLVTPDAEVGPGLQLGVGLNAPALDVATPAVFTPSVAVVMSVPAMYTGTVMGTLIKNLIESHCKTISGVNVDYTLNNESASIVGHDTQNMSVPTKTIRTQQTPSMTMQELSGNIVYETFTKWMWDISHPDTYVSMAGNVFPGAWTMSAYSMSMMIIQFDPTMRPDRILGAAFISNMFPSTVGEFGFERSLGTVNVRERSITFAPAIIQHNAYIRDMAVKVAQNLQLHTVNYDYAPPTFGDRRGYPTSDLRNLGTSQEVDDRNEWDKGALAAASLERRGDSRGIGGFVGDVIDEAVGGRGLANV